MHGVPPLALPQHRNSHFLLSVALAEASLPSPCGALEGLGLFLASQMETRLGQSG